MGLFDCESVGFDSHDLDSLLLGLIS